MKIDLFRICSSCNKTFQITEYSEGFMDIVVAFQDCPHCKERNDIWITVKKQFEEE